MSGELPEGEPLLSVSFSSRLTYGKSIWTRHMKMHTLLHGCSKTQRQVGQGFYSVEVSSVLFSANNGSMVSTVTGCVRHLLQHLAAALTRCFPALLFIVSSHLQPGLPWAVSLCCLTREMGWAQELELVPRTSLQPAPTLNSCWKSMATERWESTVSEKKQQWGQHSPSIHLIV